jgi:hypothetical protein
MEKPNNMNKKLTKTAQSKKDNEQESKINAIASSLKASQTKTSNLPSSKRSPALFLVPKPPSKSAQITCTTTSVSLKGPEATTFSMLKVK